MLRLRGGSWVLRRILVLWLRGRSWVLRRVLMLRLRARWRVLRRVLVLGLRTRRRWVLVRRAGDGVVTSGWKGVLATGCGTWHWNGARRRTLRRRFAASCGDGRRHLRGVVDGCGMYDVVGRFGCIVVRVGLLVGSLGSLVDGRLGIMVMMLVNGRLETMVVMLVNGRPGHYSGDARQRSTGNYSSDACQRLARADGDDAG